MKEQKKTNKEILYEYYFDLDKKGDGIDMDEQLLDLLTNGDNAEEREEILQEIWDKEERKLSEKDRERLYKKTFERISEKEGRDITLTPKKTSVRRAMIIAAAVIPFIIIIGAVLFINKAKPENIDEGFVATVLRTGVGERVVKALPDGSTVWLNGNSELSYESSNERVRAMKLVGESYFDVKSREKDPFIVETQHFKVIVLGTKFNVESHSYRNYSIVRLDQGEIVVKTENKQTYPLKPNQLFVHNNKSSAVEIENLENTYEMDAHYDWREGYVTCYNMSMYEIFETVEHNFNYNIHLDDAVKFDDKEYVATFLSSVSIEEILETIKFLDGGFSYEIIGRDIYIVQQNK